MTTQAMEMISSNNWNSSTPCIMPLFQARYLEHRVTS